MARVTVRVTVRVAAKVTAKAPIAFRARFRIRFRLRACQSAGWKIVMLSLAARALLALPVASPPPADLLVGASHLVVCLQQPLVLRRVLELAVIPFAAPALEQPHKATLLTICNCPHCLMILACLTLDQVVSQRVPR